jgi:hypothetical protein
MQFEVWFRTQAFFVVKLLLKLSFRGIIQKLGGIPGIVGGIFPKFGGIPGLVGGKNPKFGGIASKLAGINTPVQSYSRAITKIF